MFLDDNFAKPVVVTERTVYNSSQTPHDNWGASGASYTGEGKDPTAWEAVLKGIQR